MRISEIPATLRYLRKYRKLTLSQLAEKAGISISYLSDLERGRTLPSLDVLERIVIALDMTIEFRIED